ncbi:hypothetical protein MNY66_16495 (plasmid) [Moellerella wisconsensis]|uniref:Uncharacterized protein n=1 Tax=Moellerella wisconsensis TaxID=158849 RepID=A0ACD3YBV2_9GAMM|nr:MULTISPECIES: hypothetical protein [Morganellaceae]QCJ72223.1 hypothetical protein C9446_20700 [Providencia heimbachae]UNH40642.1 hypothetical protein MNY70_17545 [Moellerella wisconsensis]UNH44346.1 hypothetical protein MNY66_16495 [Moellerella wisconsensis]
MTTFTWKPSDSKWNQGEQLYLGKFKVASVYYDATQGRGKDPYATRCSLPGIKGNLGHYPDMVSAKDAVSNAVNYWLNRAGLQVTQAEGAKP